MSETEQIVARIIDQSLHWLDQILKQFLKPALKNLGWLGPSSDTNNLMPSPLRQIPTTIKRHHIKPKTSCPFFLRCHQRPRKDGREARIARLTLKLTHTSLFLCLPILPTRNRQTEKQAKSYLNAFCNNAILDVCSSHHPLCFMWLNDWPVE